MKDSKINRIYAIILRQFRVWIRSWNRISESFYWPVISLLLWGYVSMYLYDQGGSPNLLIVFIAGFIFWNIMQRSQEEVSIGFMEDLWNRNFINIFATPISIWEYLIALVIMGFFKVMLSSIIICIIAYLIFHFTLFTIGIYLLPFVINLFITGWWVGFFTNGMVIRYGYDVEALAWTVIFLLQPFSGVYYPLSVMPPWMQFIARLIPSSYIFEGLRNLIFQGKMNNSYLIISFILNAIFTVLALLFYKKMFEIARDKGYLTKLF